MRIGAQHPAGNVPAHPPQLHVLPQTSLHTVCTLFLRAACAGRISNCKLKIFQTQYTQAQGAMKIKEATMKKPLDLAIKWLSNWSEWRDSNSRPLAPHASALPGCATRRQDLDYMPKKCLIKIQAGNFRILANMPSRGVQASALDKPFILLEMAEPERMVWGELSAS